MVADDRKRKRRADERCLERRRDHRSESVFKLALKKWTKDEKAIMEIYAAQEGRAGRSCTYENHGMDNTGELVTDSAQVSCAPDFRLGDGYLEIKTNRYWSRYNASNVKAHNLTEYIRAGANMLMADQEGYFWFDAAALQRLQSEIPKGYFPSWQSYTHRYTAAHAEAWVEEGVLRRVDWDEEARAEIMRLNW